MLKLILILILSKVLLSTPYQVGDIVDDFSWSDSDGESVVERTLDNLVSNNKIVILTFSKND